jgi:hypothetical protein
MVPQRDVCSDLEAKKPKRLGDLGKIEIGEHGDRTPVPMLARIHFRSPLFTPAIAEPKDVTPMTNDQEFTIQYI